MKDSDVLRVVKSKLINAEYRYICEAIPNSTKNHKQSNSLKEWINKMLSGHDTYWIWLNVHYPKVARKYSPCQVQEGRLAWLDWMIDYCEKEEAK